MNFNNTAIAFASKSNTRLRKASMLFRLMNNGKLVNFGTNAATWAFKWRLPIQPLVKYTIYEQFCGGESVGDSLPVIHLLDKSNIKTILDYGVEAKQSEKEFERTAEALSRDIELARDEDAVPAISSKITALARFSLLEKVSRGATLKKKEQAAWERVILRLNKVCEAAFKYKVSIYFDAEESWIQPALDQLIMEMMAQHNQSFPVIYQTIQLYRHDRLAYLKKCYQASQKEGYLLAVKLVRGAYMEKERDRAEKGGYPSPIQPDKAATDKDFNAALEFCMKHIDSIYLCCASHNEESVLLLCDLLTQHQLENNHPQVCFAQLYGMSDHISYNLSEAGYNVAKYLVYGSVADVIPYLIRRAKENTSVTGQISRELSLIKLEMKRRRL